MPPRASNLFTGAQVHEKGASLSLSQPTTVSVSAAAAAVRSSSRESTVATATGHANQLAYLSLAAADDGRLAPPAASPAGAHDLIPSCCCCRDGGRLKAEARPREPAAEAEQLIERPPKPRKIEAEARLTPSNLMSAPTFQCFPFALPLDARRHSSPRSRAHMFVGLFFSRAKCL